MSRWKNLPRLLRRNTDLYLNVNGKRIRVMSKDKENFVDLVCVGGFNDGRRMRVFEKHKRSSLQLIVPNGEQKAVLHDKYPGRQAITYEMYQLTTINGVEMYVHSSLNPVTCVQRLLDHYQRMP